MMITFRLLLALYTDISEFKLDIISPLRLLKHWCNIHTKTVQLMETSGVGGENICFVWICDSWVCYEQYGIFFIGSACFTRMLGRYVKQLIWEHRRMYVRGISTELCLSFSSVDYHHPRTPSIPQTNGAMGP